MSQTGSYGINQQYSITDNSDSFVEELAVNGFAVMENVLDKEQLDNCRTKMDAIYALQKIEFVSGELDLINEKNLVRCPLLYDELFLNVATNTNVLDVIKKILGDYFILHLQNGIINIPGEEHHQSLWHRDLPYQNFVSSKPLAIGALFCIDDFTEKSGSTFMLPHSHKVAAAPSADFMEKNGRQVLAKAGAVILFDAMVFHKAGYNSSDFTRRAINNVYAAPILKQQINLPAALNGKYADDDFLFRFLGYESNPPSSVLEWRNNRLKKLRK